ncbi:Predicted PurR-regulated permease PerM [Hymenobacter daecheongensis DSM 21074]|uniref:Predicted PurR-regulated permease PerM n=1 Tax=Hymenobacter daecheongensis DSM 21074 TaxID=1121955 RepID=A0A1M6G309_9BACT|nr:AI-2E family transporter [Hymenobacter daecheongensis]SHJ04300.1 Predicted PurR-regulated permease PerM [Hymenobacter daecheongensis DSM 21074]
MSHPTHTIYTPYQRHVLLIVVLVALGSLILYGLGSYLSAFLGAGILYVALRPWYAALVHRRGWNRQLVAGLLLLFTVVTLMVPFYALSTMLFERLRNIGQYTDQALAVVRRLERLTGYSLTSEQTVRTLLGQLASAISRWLPTLAGGVLHLVFVMALLLFTLYYLFVQEEAFLHNLRRYLPFRPDTLDKLREALQNNVRANVVAQVLISIVQGVLTGLLLWVFGVPDPFFWGAIGFFVAFIPVLGTPLVWGPAALYQFAHGAIGQGAGILLVGGLVVMNVDNLLRILLARRMGNIHPLVTLAGATLGIILFGILGLVIGPLLLSYMGVLLHVFAQENQRARATEGPAAVENQPAEKV